MKNGLVVATMKLQSTAYCLAYSQDGSWIAAGTQRGDVVVWSAETYKHVFSYREDHKGINAVDISPDAARLVSASENCIASVFDIATRQRLLLLRHDSAVVAAKYSSDGDRLLTATQSSVRVYDNINHYFIADIHISVTPGYNNGLLWSNDHILVLSGSNIVQIDASTGSTLSEWPAYSNNQYSCIGLPKHGGFIASSTERTVALWDMSTHTQLNLIRYPQDIRSISVSPDDQFIAIGGLDGKIIVESLSLMNVSTVDCRTTYGF